MVLLGHVFKAQERFSSLSGLHSRPGTPPGPPSPQAGADLGRPRPPPARPRRALPSRALHRPPGSLCFPLDAGHRGSSSVLTRASSTRWAITVDTPPHPRTPQFRLHMPAQPRLLPAPPALRRGPGMGKTLGELVGYEPFCANSDLAYWVQEPVARAHLERSPWG